jgi:hypothetical protein
MYMHVYLIHITTTSLSLYTTRATKEIIDQLMTTMLPYLSIYTVTARVVSDRSLSMCITYTYKIRTQHHSRRTHLGVATVPLDRILPAVAKQAHIYHIYIYATYYHPYTARSTHTAAGRSSSSVVRSSVGASNQGQLAASLDRYD